MKINRTTYRATEILKLLANFPNGLTASEIGERLSIPKTSAFDIVQTLKYTHFLRETNKRFYIGFMAREVGESYALEKEMYGVAKQYIIDLADQLKMAGSLVIYEKGELDYVIEYTPEGVIITPSASGGKDFIHASASGKMLIASMSAAKQKKALSGLKFTSFTNRTITTIDDYKKELELTRERGYGVDDREWHELVTCVSVPVFNYKKVVAAITLSGLQLDRDAIPGIAEKLKQKSHDITSELEC